ncbi:MAG TPA: hypothetical protein VJG90_09075 [Candidatus Nanoarchaeia archaeon]|nr:hypothetical protein [Candidatus Nanoarchaeia archaeon]
MMKLRRLSLFLIMILALQAVWTLGETSNETFNAESNTTKAQTYSKYVKTEKKEIVGTKKFISKQNMRKKLLEQQTNFPYDINEAIAWVRTNKISIVDPISKKSLLVNILSDEQIKAYLLIPLGRKLSGVDDAGLEKSQSTVTLISDKAAKQYYSISSHRKDIDKNRLSPGQSGKKELPYYLLRVESSTEPPQNGNINEEYAWVRGNLQTVYDPFKKQTLSVTRASQEYLKYLLKAPQVRKNIGLPPIEGEFKKSTSFS